MNSEPRQRRLAPAGLFGVTQPKQPHVCPVCGGKGKVPRNFYGDQTWSTAVMPEPTCKSCGGSGVIIC